MQALGGAYLTVPLAPTERAMSEAAIKSSKEKAAASLEAISGASRFLWEVRGHQQENAKRA